MLPKQKINILQQKRYFQMIDNLTIKKAQNLVLGKKANFEEITKYYFDRIKKFDKKVNSFLTVTEDIAIASSKKAQNLITQNSSLLTGIPAAIKDVFVTEGVRTTASSKILENFIPPYDATVITKLKDNNFVLLGKTNHDEFAMGGSSENSAYGPVRNPLNLEMIPGGSSGGSAAAVAADFCVFALGSDTGGSIRQPASMCGVVGLKPTYGRVSRYGLIAMASSLDTVGPITKNVEDAAIVLNSIAGYDPMDATSSKENVLDYSLQLFDLPKGLKVGLPKEYFDEGLDTVVGDRIKKTIEVFKKLGIEVVEISLPHVGYSLAAYYVIMPSEASSNLARFDGIRYGKTRDHFGDEVKRRIILGTFALSSGYFDQYYNKARQVRKIIKDEVDEALQKVDAIIGPTAPTTAWKIGEKVDDPLKMYLSDVYTVTANLIGSPAISIPVGESNGLPVGLQILGKDFDEKTILQIANAVEKELNLSFKPDF